MTYFYGDTLHEVLSKAIGKSKPRARRQRKIGPAKQSTQSIQRARQGCLHLQNDFRRVRQLVQSHLSHAQTLESEVRRLRGEQLGLWIRLLADAAVIALPIAKIFRLGKAIDRVLTVLNAGRAGAEIELAIEIVVDIIGVYDAILNVMRIAELPDEIDRIERRMEDAQSEAADVKRELEQIRDVYKRLGCEGMGPILPGV